MAITTQKSTEVTAIDAGTLLDTNTLKGRVRVAYFEHTQSGVGDATSSVEVVRLPSGKVRLLASQSKAFFNWVTATATADFGWDAYTDINGVAVVADPNGLDDGIDVELAGYQTFGAIVTATGGTKVFESQDGVSLRITSEDEALADGDVVAGYVLYVID
ncbi:MAG: hypothetical protein KAT00_05765 [Planctomycetes bacterium]|nr:hypothetical protein [Planctomycetota bacterium]